MVFIIPSTVQLYQLMFICNETFNDFSLQYGRSLLHVASANGQADIVNILVAHGANVDTLDRVRSL